MKYQARRIYSWMPGGDNAAWAWKDLGPSRNTPEEAFADFYSEDEEAKRTAGALSARYGDNDEYDVVIVLRDER
ncbi:MAG: hypothetical protein AAB605_02485 [Patescibacteria group bacterium]